MSEKISTLVLKVDLNCPQCCKKIKKILSKFSCVIKSQVFDEKQNTVTISGPFDPNCFSKKLCCKAGKTIKSIEIIKPDPPKPPAPKPNPPPAPAPEPKQPEPAPKKPEPEPKKPEPAPAPKKPEPEPKKPEPAPAPKKPEPEPKKPEPEPKKPEPAPAPKKPEPEPKKPEPEPKKPEPVHVPITYEPVTGPGYPPNFGVCCGQCYEGYGGGPCYHGHGGPAQQPQPCYDGGLAAYGRYNRPCYVRCDYFSEENPSGCTIM